MNRFVAMAVVAGSILFVAQAAMAQPEEGQFYRIRNINSKKVLGIEEKGKEEGAKIIQVPSGPGELQQWKFVKFGDYYKIVNRKTGKALNVQNESKEEGTPIIQWDANVDNENQQWQLEKKGGNYVFKVRHSGMVLDVAEGSKERKAPLI